MIGTWGPSGAWGQESWQGPASLVVQATDADGQAVPGATVLLRFVGGESPGPVLQGTTDFGGRLFVENLAEGEWQVDVRREGFMLFTAYLRLAAAQGPELGFSTRQRTGTFWAPLEVVFYEAGGTPPDTRGKKGKKLDKQARKRAQRLERRAAKAEPPDAPSRRGGDRARVVSAEPVPAPAPTPEPAAPVADPPTPPTPPTPPVEIAEEAPAPRAAPPEVPPLVRPSPEAAASPQAEEPTAPSPTPAPDREVPPRRPQRPAETRVAEAAPAPTPEPEPAATPTPPAAADLPAPSEPARLSAEAEPAPPQPAPAAEAAPAPVEVAEASPARRRARDRTAPRPRVPTIQSNPVLRPAGACPECKPGEWSVTAELDAAPHIGGAQTESCPPDLEARMGRAAGIVAAAATAQEQVASYAGPVADRRGLDLLNRLGTEDRRSLAAQLSPLVDPASSCQVLAVVLPAGARYIGFRYEAGEGLNVADCLPEQDCLIGQSQWRALPTLKRGPQATVVYGIFKNTSPQNQRRSRFTVYFAPPRGWLPPTSP